MKTCAATQIIGADAATARMMANPAHTQVLRAVTLRRIITNATKPAIKVARTALTCNAWFDVAPVPVSTEMMVAPAMSGWNRGQNCQ